MVLSFMQDGEKRLLAFTKRGTNIHSVSSHLSFYLGIHDSLILTMVAIYVRDHLGLLCPINSLVFRLEPSSHILIFYHYCYFLHKFGHQKNLLK